MKKIMILLAGLAVAFGASAGDFRWGGSNRNNKVKYNNTYAYLGSGNCRVPHYSSGASTALNGSSALTYLYLGKAEFRNGVINLGKLTYLTNSTPQASGLFGNYTTAPVAAKLIQDGRVDPNGGQDFTILVVTPDTSGKLPPKTLTGGKGGDQRPGRRSGCCLLWSRDERLGKTGWRNAGSG